MQLYAPAVFGTGFDETAWAATGISQTNFLLTNQGDIAFWSRLRTTDPKENATLEIRTRTGHCEMTGHTAGIHTLSAIVR
jgi:hypothetical protein